MYIERGKWGTHGLTSNLFSNLPGWSGRMTSHSNLSAAAAEAIVLILIPVTLVGIVLKLRWKVRERRDMSDLINALRKVGVSGRKVGCNCGA
jgi:hypothetical protein